MGLSAKVEAMKPGSISLTNRQQLLLDLLGALGGCVGNLDFQKQLFLYCQQSPEHQSYDFVPYKFGAFSFTSYADRRKLVEHGLLEVDEREWKLTGTGRKLMRHGDNDAYTFAKQHEHLKGDRLVAQTYRLFPYYAIRSVVAKKVLRGDEKALKQIEASRPKKKGSALSTIGYEGRSLENYLNTLLLAGVTLLCDVRRNPLSRKYGFSKKTLSNGCEGVGIRYEHLPELGVASEQRQNLETEAQYELLFAEYERANLPSNRPVLLNIRSWIEAGEHVALTCYERLPSHCHRHCVAEALETEFGNKFAVNHL